jgi:hypothetical protein
LVKGNSKEVVSVDESVQALVEMWDENQAIVGIHPRLEPIIKEGDFVLVRFIQGDAHIMKVFKSKKENLLWKEMREFHERKKKSFSASPEGFQMVR